MRHLRRIRVAIFTSAGLLPLACANGRAVDSADATHRGEASDVGDDTDVVDATDVDVGAVDVPASATLPSCGPDQPIAAEHLSRGISGFTPVRTAGIESGIYRCETNGLLHRPEPVTCASGLPRPLPPSDVASDAGSTDMDGAITQVAFLYPDISSLGASCTADADCTERPYGYCAPAYYGGPVPYNIQCKYGCLSDADCGSNELCQCGDPVGHCVAADCRSDGDCGGELTCAAWFTPPVCAGEQFYTCQTEDDECNTSADCAAGYYCSGQGGVRRCVAAAVAACGRPFLVRDEARMANIVEHVGWVDGEEVGLGTEASASTPSSRRVGEYWARAALMEHASIAAFARFTLQLLHLGAPRGLVEASQQAMLDETNHAKACFALATRHLGRPVAPGPLPMSGALQSMELGHIVVTTFLEGCVGETVAALEANDARDAATDEQAQRVLTRIGADELRHAELAWKFVRWALELGEPGVEALVVAELARLERESVGTPSEAEPLAPEHGVLSAKRRAQIRRLALSEVVLPCGRELLAQTRSGSAHRGSVAAARSCSSTSALV